MIKSQLKVQQPRRELQPATHLLGNELFSNAKVKKSMSSLHADSAANAPVSNQVATVSGDKKRSGCDSEGSGARFEVVYVASEKIVQGSPSSPSNVDLPNLATATRRDVLCKGLQRWLLRRGLVAEVLEHGVAAQLVDVIVQDVQGAVAVAGPQQDLVVHA